jgi:UDP-MurNAc hydroxylase
MVRLEAGGHCLLIDVWLKDGIYEGGWHTFPPVQDRETPLRGATHLYVSHIHEDHFDLETIAMLPRDIQVLLPRVYPFQVMQSKLRALGFSRIEVIETGKRSSVGSDLAIEVIAPMNSYGQQKHLYDLNEEASPIAIDTGLIVRTGVLSAVFLADNFPYDLDAAGASLERMSNCDLMAFPYNGTASDFPFCYNSFSDEQIRSIVRGNEKRRADALDNLIRRIHPKLLMPYSSDFAPAGPAAMRFAAVASEWWTDKQQVAKRYGTEHRVPSTYLWERDVLELDAQGYKVERGGLIRPSLVEALKLLSTDFPLTIRKYSQAVDRTALVEAIGMAAQNLFSAMDRYELKSNWILELKAIDARFDTVQVDLRERKVSNAKTGSERPCLSCEIDAGFLDAILWRQSHWNNAQLSFQLKWTRTPDQYDDGLYKSLSYFHVPVTQQRRTV